MKEAVYNDEHKHGFESKLGKCQLNHWLSKLVSTLQSIVEPKSCMIHRYRIVVCNETHVSSQTDLRIVFSAVS